MARRFKHPNRFELKYLLRARQVDEVVDALGPYVTPDPHATHSWGYPIYSVYCDSPRLDFFWEKVEGLKYRRKVRFRTYGESDTVFLEIKQRVDRTLQKRRTTWPRERVEKCFFSGALDEAAAGEGRDPVADEIFVLWRLYDLQPNMGISYRRRAFFAADESDLRITFDSRVRYHHAEHPVGRPPDEGRYLVDPELSILEIKYGQAVPLWLCKLVERRELQLVRLSKYCTAIDRCHFQGEVTMGEEGRTWTS